MLFSYANATLHDDRIDSLLQLHFRFDYQFNCYLFICQNHPQFGMRFSSNNLIYRSCFAIIFILFSPQITQNPQRTRKASANSEINCTTRPIDNECRTGCFACTENWVHRVLTDWQTDGLTDCLIEWVRNWTDWLTNWRQPIAFVFCICVCKPGMQNSRTAL